MNTAEGNAIFDESIEVTWLGANQPFTQPGDSGSIIFLDLKGEKVAIGLHFAGGIKSVNHQDVGVSYSCDLTEALRQLDVEWWEE